MFGANQGWDSDTYVLHNSTHVLEGCACSGTSVLFSHGALSTEVDHVSQERTLSKIEQDAGWFQTQAHIFCDFVHECDLLFILGFAFFVECIQVFLEQYGCNLAINLLFTSNAGWLVRVCSTRKSLYLVCV